MISSDVVGIYCCLGVSFGLFVLVLTVGRAIFGKSEDSRNIK